MVHALNGRAAERSIGAARVSLRNDIRHILSTARRALAALGREPARETTMPAQLDEDIATIDLSAACNLLARKHYWPYVRIRKAEREFRVMLQLVRQFPAEPIVPTPLADEFWHACLMVNEVYQAHCAQLFGRELYHDPFAGMRGAQDQQDQIVRFQRSRRLQAGLEGRLSHQTSKRNVP
jgi:hypothetical protein